METMSAQTPSTAATVASEDHVLDESGHFHVTDAPIDLGHYTVEAWIAFAFFWLLALNVFYQLFTRSVRTIRHIHVDFLYRLSPRQAGRILATLVDVVKTVFFAFATGLTWQMMEKMV